MQSDMSTAKIIDFMVKYIFCRINIYKKPDFTVEIPKNM